VHLPRMQPAAAGVRDLKKSKQRTATLSLSFSLSLFQTMILNCSSFASADVIGAPHSWPLASFRCNPVPVNAKIHVGAKGCTNLLTASHSNKELLQGFGELQSLTIWKRRVRRVHKWRSPFNVWYASRNRCSESADQNVSRDIVAQVACWILLGKSVDVYVT
jgi:hypothetical protein